MSKEFRIQIGGKTYTPDNVHEITGDPNIGPASGDVTNVSDGEVTGARIQAGDVHGGITINRH